MTELFDPAIHHRRSIRLCRYDYSTPGMYFVTICAHRKEHLFGEVIEEEMRQNECGKLVASQWLELPRHCPQVRLDAFCVMPNHIHGIIQIETAHAKAVRESQAERSVGAIHESPLRRRRMLLPRIIGRFKMNRAKRVNEVRHTPGALVWQRNYYEHIIRKPQELDIIREYIATNALRWGSDLENVPQGRFVNRPYFRQVGMTDSDTG